MNATQFIHVATIDTPGASVSKDKDGMPIPGAVVTLTGVGCRYGDLSRTEIANLAQGGLTNVQSYLLVGRTVAATMDSRVSAITHRLSGVVQDAGPFEVAQILKRRAGGVEYQALTLRRVS